MSQIRQVIEARIRDQVTDLRHVAGAVDMGAAAPGRAAPPSAYVFEAATSASGDGVGGQQQVVESFAVVIVVNNKRDPRGADSADVCRDLRTKIFQALAGWEPDATHDPMFFHSGSLVSFENGFLYWQDVYKTVGVWPD